MKKDMGVIVVHMHGILTKKMVTDQYLHWDSNHFNAVKCSV